LIAKIQRIFGVKQLSISSYLEVLDLIERQRVNRTIKALLYLNMEYLFGFLN